jgi:hypothetical protein
MKNALRLARLVNQPSGRDGPPDFAKASSWPVPDEGPSRSLQSVGGLGRPISIPARPATFAKASAASRMQNCPPQLQRRRAVAPYQLLQAILRGIIMRSQTASWVLAALMLVLLGGCLEEHLMWSPDGKRAAVIAKDGLHFCDPEGKLTPLLLPGVDRVAWFSNSQQLAVARTRSVGDWASIARAIGSARAAAITAKADEIWSKVEAGAQLDVLIKSAFLNGLKETQPLSILLRERHGEALKAKLSPGDWDSLKAAQVDLTDLLIVRVDGDQIRPGIVLHEGLEKIENIRVAPGDRAIAFTTDLAPGNDKECRLLLARVDIGGATTVAERTAFFPDWTPDCRSLVYVQAAEGGAKGDLRLGTLVRRVALDEHDVIKIQKDTEELAGLLFSNAARVRCLRDGRIMFNAVEFSLPVTNKDVEAEREKLFVLDPARQSTLVRVIPRGEEENMPKNLTFFELSPDEQRVLVGGFEGEVSLLTIATGDVGRLQKAGDYGLMAAPVWRNNDEITYAKRNPVENGKQPARQAEIVLQEISPAKGDHETVLSKDWSVEMLESIFSGSDKK